MTRTLQERSGLPVRPADLAGLSPRDLPHQPFKHHEPHPQHQPHPPHTTPAPLFPSAPRSMIVESFVPYTTRIFHHHRYCPFCLDCDAARRGCAGMVVLPRGAAPSERTR
jgi:hypothetical protein